MVHRPAKAREIRTLNQLTPRSDDMLAPITYATSHSELFTLEPLLDALAIVAAHRALHGAVSVILFFAGSTYYAVALGTKPWVRTRTWHVLPTYGACVFLASIWRAARAAHGAWIRR